MYLDRYLEVLLPKRKKTEREPTTRYHTWHLETSPTTPEINQAWFFSTKLIFATQGTKKPQDPAVKCLLDFRLFTENLF